MSLSADPKNEPLSGGVVSAETARLLGDRSCPIGRLRQELMTDEYLVHCAVCGAEIHKGRAVFLGARAARSWERPGWRCLDDDLRDKHLREEFDADPEWQARVRAFYAAHGAEEP